MKNKCIKILAILLIVVFGIQMLVIASNTTPGVWREFYVSVNGSDSNDGSINAPFLTIDKAKESILNISNDMQGDIIVNIGGGYHFLDNTIEYGTADSGKNGYKIIYRGEKDNMPIISGGVQADLFTKTDFNENIWQTTVANPDIEYIRELYVDEKKAKRASSDRTMMGVNVYKAPDSIYTSDGMYMSKDDIGFYENPEDMELKWAQGWVTCVCPADSILQDPENSNQVILKMQQSWWDVQMVTGGVLGLGAKHNFPFQVENAMELLDTPGEFYFNRKTKILYYMPKEDENMETATVIIPRIEKLVKINGNDVDKKVQNLSFEGLKFAHATWFYPSEHGLIMEQQQKLGRYYDVFMTIPGAIDLNRASNINFSGNYFFGYGAAGVDLINSVDNVKIDGNAFSDIGNAAIVSGRGYHGGVDGWVNKPQNVPPKNSNLQLNLVNGTQRVTASYYGKDENNNILSLLGKQFWAEESEYLTTETWQSDPLAPQKGEKSWVKFDFDSAYSMSKIVLGFDLTKVKADERNNYEILLSNDRSFREGNYKVVATQTTPATRFQTYTELPSEKYRYMMVRTLGATNLALSNAYVFTPDMPLYTSTEINKKNMVSNNYINRVDDALYGGIGISGGYNEELSILHNEVIDVTYSGISIGYGWNMGNKGSNNNNISYNFVKDACQMMGDGGGIYTLSHQPGTKITNNYVTSLFEANGAYYPDEGSSYEVWSDNVAEDVLMNWHVWTNTIQFNKMFNTYSTHDTVRYNGINNEFEPVKVFLPGTPPKEAYSIKKNAGLEPQYTHLRDLVYEGKLNLVDQRVRYMDMIMGGLIDTGITALNKVATNILSNGLFGSLPGEYPLEYKYKLQDIVEKISAAPASEKVERMIELRSLIAEIQDSVNHLSLDEMIIECEKTLEEATVCIMPDELNNNVCVKIKETATSTPTIDSYSASSIAKFSNAIKFAKQEATLNLTDAEQYNSSLNLEEAYRTFLLSKAVADIEYVNVEGSNNVEIDNENKVITVYFPLNSSMKNRKTEILPFGNSQLATSVSTLNLTSPVIIPMYNKAVNKYVNWTIQGSYEKAPIENSDWYTRSTQTVTVAQLPNGNHFLTSNFLPYVKSEQMANGKETILNFKPITSLQNNSFTILFGANTKDVKLDGTSEGDNRFELVVTNKIANLYSVVNGAKTHISKFDFNVNYNKENTMKISLTKQNNSTLIKLSLNNKQIINNLSNLLIENSYLGIYSPKIGVEIIGS